MREGIWKPLVGMWLPLGVFAAAAMALWLNGGVRPAGDTPLYLNGALRLRQGLPLEGAQHAYAGYIAFVALHQWLGLKAAAIITTQVALGAMVLVTSYDAGARLAGWIGGGLAAWLYAVNLDLARFHYYVLSDSLFTSLLWLSAYAAIRASSGCHRVWTVLAAILAVVLVTVRLNGWLALPCLAAFLLLPGKRRGRSVRWATWGIVVMATCVGLRWTLSMNGSLGGTGTLLAQGRVVAADSSSVIPMPPAAGSDTGLLGSGQYCAAHPGACLRLMSRRMAVELAHTRPYYSPAHNLVIRTTLPLLYGLALVGIVAYWRHSFTWLALVLVGLQLMVVGMSGADWDGRFLLMVMPLLTFLSGVGGMALMRRWLPPSYSASC